MRCSVKLHLTSDLGSMMTASLAGHPGLQVDNRTPTG